MNNVKFCSLLVNYVCIFSLIRLSDRSKRVANAQSVAEVERHHAHLAIAQRKLEKAKKQVTAATGKRILQRVRARVAEAKRRLATTALGSKAHKDAIKRLAVAQVCQY
jgi:hypothetical protein